MNDGAPLAERLRPQKLDDLVGQEHLAGSGSILRRAIESGKIPSMILWGPPGSGKTTIAHIIANTLKVHSFSLSAISAGVKEVRDIIQQAQKMKGAILFIDEIHRFNKGQQDALLGAVEKGIITLIGATTENPSFEVNSALLSRCQVYVLKPLSENDLIELLHYAIANDDWLKTKNIIFKETEALLTISGGDARKLLNLLELVVASQPSKEGKAGTQAQPVENFFDGSDMLEEESFDYKTGDPTQYGLLKEFVREHRSHPTEGEAILWELLRGKQMEGHKFRRQHIIGNFIADFVCLPNKLIIQVDGLIHQLPDNKLNDEERTEWFNKIGFEVIRFKNEEVTNQTNSVIKKILAALKRENEIADSQKSRVSAVDNPPLGGRGAGLVITDDLVMQIAQQRIALYDKSGEQHYDIISAFIKSMRGSDPNAAIYWLARMIEGGEDVKFIARRMVIFASEDISNANANALLLANATFDAVNKIGYPEARIILAQCAVYLASSAKSNASYMAIEEALEIVQKEGDLPVPLHIRNAPTGLMKRMGYGKNYKYAHSYEGNFTEQEFLPEKISGTAFYEPGKNGKEEEIRKHLRNLWKNKYNY